MIDNNILDVNSIMHLGQTLLPRLFDSVQDGILVIDLNNVVVFVNDAYTNITGVRREDIVGRPLKEVRLGAQLPEVVETGRSKVGCYRKESGTEYIVDMFPIQGGSKIIGGLSIVWDIGRIRKLVESLGQSNSPAEKEFRQSKTMPRTSYSFDDIIFGDASIMHDIISFARRVASSDANVLITGESGTGKELLAHSIHNVSARWNEPFIAINCAALPSQLLESELFGYSDGAFTGARKGGKPGLFASACRGTVFLDEIGDMSLDLQAKLLRVIQEKKIRPLGSDQEAIVDIRIISATNKDLPELIRSRLFREDLFYRINVLPINIPPLRERKEDIPLLIEHYCHDLGKRINRPIKLDSNVVETMLSYPWPGNIRELHNILEFMAYFTTKSDIILPAHLPPMIRDFNLSRKNVHKYLNDFEKELLIDTIKKYGWDYKGKQQAARELQVSLATLYNKLKKYGISKSLE